MIELGRLRALCAVASHGTVTGSSVRFTTAGTHTVTATLDANPAVTATASVTVTADHAHPASLDLSLSDVSVDEGGSITAVVTGVDSYGNPLGDLTSAARITSDHPGDRIVGGTITFPSASTHVITASYNGAVTSAAVTVIPRAGLMARTGSELGPAIALGAALLIAGMLALLIARHRRTRG